MPETRYFTCNLCEAMCGLSLSVEAGQIVELRGDTEDVDRKTGADGVIRRYSRKVCI